MPRPRGQPPAREHGLVRAPYCGCGLAAQKEPTKPELPHIKSSSLGRTIGMTKVFIEPRPKKTSLNHPLTYGPPSSSTIARSVQRMGDLASGVT